MKIGDLKKMSHAELQEELKSLLREQFNMRMQKGTEQLVRSHLIRNTRRNIARVKTILKEKQMKGERDE